MSLLVRALIGSLFVSLAACGGSDDGDQTVATPSTAAPDASVAVPEADPVDDGCEGIGAQIESALDDPAVTGVEVFGQCTAVSVATDLGDDAFDADTKEAATAICESAAAVAYEGEISSVSVDSGDGTELAIGIEGAPCL